jgi:hypothetical protein
MSTTRLHPLSHSSTRRPRTSLAPSTPDRKITIGELVADLKQWYETKHMARMAADLQTR